MENKNVLLTLLACAVSAFLFILTHYMWHGRNPSNRMGYGIFMSVAPAIAAFLLLRLTELPLSWQRTVGIYIVMFVLTAIIQSYARTIPID
jgi:glucan phosphoethanolaminetransferase (alkaline phosphatase superfamily)